MRSFLITIFCILAPHILASEYSVNDLPSVSSVISHCFTADVNNSFTVMLDHGKIKEEEIFAMAAIIYQLPSGARKVFDIDTSSPERQSQFSTQLLHAYMRHIAFLAVRLRVANATATSITKWLWSQKFDFVTCNSENRAAECLCDPVGSLNSTGCQLGIADCKCTPQTVGADCSVCVDNNYRDYSRYEKGCLSCQCAHENFVGPCSWRHVGDPNGSEDGGIDRRQCSGCKPGFEGDACLPVGSGGMGLTAKVFLALACILGILALLGAFVVLRRHCRRRALRAARHSLAVQRLFSRFKDDTSLEAEAAEASAILAEEDALQRATQQLRLGADPVYQPTTVSIT